MKSWGRIMPLNKAWGDQKMTNIKLSYNEMLIILELLRNEKGNIASEEEKENLKNKLINGISDHSATLSEATEI